LRRFSPIWRLRRRPIPPRKCAEQETSLERKRRNAIQDQAYIALRNDRAAVGGLFNTTDPLVNTLPRSSPEPDSPPDAVVATTSWDAATQQARITCTASTDPNLSYYDIRDCASPDYSTETESVVGSIDPASPLKFLRAAHLINPGNIDSFKA